MLRNTVAHPDHVPAAAARRLVFGWLDSRAYAATSGEMRGAAFEDQGLVRVPVKIAWAEHDRVVSRAGPERVPPGARQLVLADCGHIPTWDDPGQVVRIVLGASSAG